MQAHTQDHWLNLGNTTLNPVPNAQMCVSDDTYYKITTTNYISKTSLYITFHMYPSGPWMLKILMFALLATHDIATYSCWPWEKTGDGKYMLGLLLDIKILGVPPLGPGMPFLDNNTCAEGALFISARVFFPVWCHRSMDRKSFMKNDHDILYYM